MQKAHVTHPPPPLKTKPLYTSLSQELVGKWACGHWVCAGGGGAGGGGGEWLCDAGDEHTRQPEEVTLLSEDHWIVPGPNTKLEGPVPPLKAVNVPDGWLGMRRKSYPPSVLKEVAVRGLPRAGAVGVMEHAS